MNLERIPETSTKNADEHVATWEKQLQNQIPLERGDEQELLRLIKELSEIQDVAPIATQRTLVALHEIARRNDALKNDSSSTSFQKAA